MSAAATTLAVLYYICLPFVWILRTLLAVVLVVLSPLLHLAHYVLHACWVPFQFLARFETLYIYFGVALLVGVLVGALIHYCAAFAIAFLGMDKPEENGTILDSWRGEKAGPKPGQRKAELRSPTGLHSRFGRPMAASPDWLQHDKGGLKSPTGLMSTTILEEDDSSEIEYV